MSLLRLILFLSFSSQGNPFGALLSSFLLGLRYDLRCVCSLSLLLLITGSFSSLHPFRTGAGRKLALSLVGFASFLLAVFYTVDFAYYGYLSQRLNASVLNYLEDAGISAKMVWQTYPVLRILLLWIAATWGIYTLARLAYKRIGRAQAPPTGKMAAGGLVCRSVIISWAWNMGTTRAIPYTMERCLHPGQRLSGKPCNEPIPIFCEQPAISPQHV